MWRGNAPVYNIRGEALAGPGKETERCICIIAPFGLGGLRSRALVASRCQPANSKQQVGRVKSSQVATFQQPNASATPNHGTRRGNAEGCGAFLARQSIRPESNHREPVSTHFSDYRNINMKIWTMRRDDGGATFSTKDRFPLPMPPVVVVDHRRHSLLATTAMPCHAIASKSMHP
jgi:hypothetical protein